MDSIWIKAILSVLIVSIMSFTGVAFLAFKPKLLKKIVPALVSFAVGALLGNAFLHLLPEGYLHTDNVLQLSVLVFAGVLSLFLLEKLLHWNHNHDIPDEKAKIQPLGFVSLYADALHNFADGLLIGASWLISPEIGLAATVAIIVHEIPQEISDFAILIHAGFTKKKALLLNFLSALTAVLGTFIALLLGTRVHGLSNVILPLAAGGFIYLACSDLIPELHKESKPKDTLIQLAVIIAGFALIYVVTGMGTHSHVH